MSSQSGNAPEYWCRSPPDPGGGNTDIDLEKFPELKQVYELRQLLFIPDAKLMAVPMVAQDAVLGFIYIRSRKLGSALSETA